MDSIELTEKTKGKRGESCKVTVSTGDVYAGIFNGYSESTPDNPLVLRLILSKDEAARIGVSYLREIGMPYDVIRAIEF